ncbi:reverse transcriptase [Gossypium australe]|uniref:Reverse transcriptase n=1 Tax=Gossypium australe TaxID=47621 RepID=A0A5B6VPP2_9ROSI|nr:reverse transcriptase [Gossypium australe]
MDKVTWNVRGLGSGAKIDAVNRSVKMIRANVCFLQETKLETVPVDLVRKIWGDDCFDFKFVVAIERSRGLLTIWDKGWFSVNVVFCGKRFIVVEGKWVHEGKEAVLINLVDLPLLGKKFTWIGPDSKRSRLDRFLIEEDWLVHSKDFQQQELNRSISDHIPVLLVNESFDWGPRPFKFVNAWLKKEDCRRLIETEWLGMGGLRGQTAVKLRKLKGALNKWDVGAGNIFEKIIIESEDRIKEIDEASEQRKLIKLEMGELKKLNIELWEAIKFKESIWCQKSRMSWLKEEDANSAFFHRAVKIRAKRKMVYSLKIEGRWYKEPKEMKEGQYNFFNNYFDCPTKRWKIDLDLNFRMLNEEIALKLEEPFSLEEIKEAVWSCDESNAPGPDGFNLWFFRNCWETVKMDLFGPMSDFFSFRESLRRASTRHLSHLFLKWKIQIKFQILGHFFLLSSLYKIVSKVLSRRLREIVGVVVSDTQCAFIRANELIYLVKKKRGSGGYLIFKLDFSKAYDNVRWDFLELVFFKMRFGEKWRGWMMECISTA